jgi:hypothetical protein
MVGRIEPLGTSFQSASEERMENRISARISNGRISLRQNWRARARNGVVEEGFDGDAFMVDLTGGWRGCSSTCTVALQTESRHGL